MGRLWQTLILSRWQPVLAFLPVETVIQSRQDAYYQQLSRADSRSDCTDFILFLLEALRDALASAIQVQPAIPIKTRAETPVETRAETRREPVPQDQDQLLVWWPRGLFWKWRLYSRLNWEGLL